MTTKDNLQNHLKAIILEITKVDDQVNSTENIPVDQLTRLRKRREELNETCEYIKYLVHVDAANNKPKEESKLIKL